MERTRAASLQIYAKGRERRALLRWGRGSAAAPDCAALSEVEAHGQLRLPRIAHTIAQKAVKVEQPWGRQRIDVVLVVEGVEHLELGDDSHALAEVERSCHAKVKCEVAVVFAQVIPSAVDDGPAWAGQKPMLRIGRAACGS